VNPYVTDRRMIGRIADAARRGAKVRLFVPAEANNWACAAAQHHHHRALLDAGVRILEYPTMLHAKAFVRDNEMSWPGRATSKPGASGVSSSSMCSFDRERLQLSSKRGSRHLRRSCQHRDALSSVRGNVFGPRHSRSSRRFSETSVGGARTRPGGGGCATGRVVD